MTDVVQPDTDPGVQRLVVKDVADTPSLKGQTFVTNWFQVGPEKLPLFDEATYTDTSSHDVDHSAYPEDLVEGYHLVALLDYLMNDVLYVDRPWVAWNYGMDRVRFVSPIRASDRWRLHGKVEDVTERSGGYLLRLSVASEIQGRDKPGFTVEQLVLWRAAEADDGFDS